MILVVVAGIHLFLKISDINTRNNMNFDEFDWSWDLDASNPTVYEYDKQQPKGQSQRKIGFSVDPMFMLIKCLCIVFAF